MVIAVPITILVILAGIQVGLYWHARTVTTAAVQDAMRVVQAENGNAADAQLALDDMLAPSSGLVTITHQEIFRGDRSVSVTVSATVTSVIPGWGDRVTVTVFGPRERFVPQAQR